MRFVLTALLVVALGSPAFAFGKRNRSNNYVPATTARATAPVVSAPTPNSNPTSFSTASAQGVANIMASRNQVGHWGGNPGYEGCGCGGSPQAAYSICCYANSGMTTVDVGYAQAANGMWYCCRRYR